jgi:hypothetical protein
VSRSDTERLRDILECIEAIDRAEATVRRYPGDPYVAKVALDAVQRRSQFVRHRGMVLGDQGGRA